MIGGPNPSIANLSAIYSSNNTAIALALTRIASGKRVQNASDDLVAYTAAANLQSHSDQYAVIKQNLAEAKGFFDYATKVGDTIVSDINRLSDLKGLYDAAVAANDLTAQDADKAEYDAIIGRINGTIANANYEGYPVYQAAALYKSVSVNLNGGSFRLTPTAVAATGTINDITAGGVLAAIQTQQTNAITYAAQVASAGDALTAYSNLADTVINSNEATISVLTGIDDASELAGLTSLQVRQQATVAMMAQANVIQGYAAKLYGGNN